MPYRHQRLGYLKTHRQTLHTSLLLSGKLNDHLADLNEEATAMAAHLVRELAQRKGADERLKAAETWTKVFRMKNRKKVAAFLDQVDAHDDGLHPIAYQTEQGVRYL